MFTTLTNFGTSGDRIPGHLCPLYLRFGRHIYLPKISSAILTAVGAPRGLAEAKNSKKIGTFLEFRRAREVLATRTKTVSSLAEK